MGILPTPPLQRAAQLRERIAEAESELQRLKEELAQVKTEEENEVGTRRERQNHDVDVGDTTTISAATTVGKGYGANGEWKWPLSAEEYDRYGRQLILPNVSIHGQKRLNASKILIVGAGGLGCPAAAYIAGAGVGTLGVVDGDVVEPSNLHRQIAHATSRVGILKVDSLIAYCRELNPLPTYIPHRSHLIPETAEAIVRDYDLVLDCTDHPTSRYLISDICVLLGKPLVSASALRTDGQLIVLNTPPTPQGTPPPTVTASNQTPSAASAAPLPPCYRCIFPKPPPPDSVVSCGEGGVLGPVVGVMGVLQALEAIKIIAAGLHLPTSFSQSPSSPSQSAAAPATMAPPTLLLFSGATPGTPTFRSVKMRSRRKDCLACGSQGPSARSLTLETLRSGSLDYVAFCGGQSAPVTLLSEDKRVSPREYVHAISGETTSDEVGTDDEKKKMKQSHVLLDVREKELFDIAAIDGAVNVPYSRIQGAARRTATGTGGSATATVGAAEGPSLPDWIPPDLAEDAPIYVVCRLGNDSQLVAKQLLDLGLGKVGERWIGDIKGGMRAWRDTVDSTLPFL